MNNIQSLRRPISFFWEPTELCNLKCKHCYTNSSYDKPLGISFEKAKAIVDKMNDEGIYSMGIGGGEPLMIPFISELIKYIYSKGMNASISTNGILLTDKKIIQLKEAGLKIIQISIDGLKENHEYIRGPGTYDGLFAKIRILSKHDIGVRVGFTITSKNYKEVGTFIEYAKSEGVEVINFFRYMPYSYYDDELSLSPEQLFEVTKLLINYEDENIYKIDGVDKKFYITFEPLSFFAFLVDKKYLSKTTCTAGKSKFNLSADGSISLCNYIPNKVGNINENDISNIWEQLKMESAKLSSIPKNCENCEYALTCRGGCKGFSYKVSNDYITKDPGCFINLSL